MRQKKYNMEKYKKLIEVVLKETNTNIKNLYVCRYLNNSEEVYQWYKKQGTFGLQPPDKFHVTISYSKKELDWNGISPLKSALKIPVGQRETLTLGNANVLKFVSPILEKRWNYFIEHGASYDFDTYIPHMSFAYDSGQSVKNIKPFMGELYFGPEVFDTINE